MFARDAGHGCFVKVVTGGQALSNNGHAWKTACRHVNATPYTDSMLSLLIDSRTLGLDLATCIHTQDRAIACLEAPEERVYLNATDAPRRQTHWILIR